MGKTHAMATVKRTLFFALVGICFLSFKAFGDDGDKQALELHRKGVELFNNNKYLEASAAFREAQRLKPTWKLHYNVGQCEAAAKRYGLALEAFESYLVEGGDEVPDDRREYVSNEIRRIQPLVGIVEVEAPKGAEVLIDGEVRATVPLAGPLRVAAGRHELVLEKENEILLKKWINVAGGITTTVAVSGGEETAAAEETEPAESAPPEKEIAPEPAREREPGRSPLWTAGWIGVGVGAAMAVGGAVTGGMAMGKSNDLADSCPDKVSCSEDDEKLKESAEKLALVTDILIPVGAAVAVTGVVLLILGRPGRGEVDEGTEVSLVPVAGPGLGGFVVEGRF